MAIVVMIRKPPELVEACLQPGVSAARMALEHGINASADSIRQELEIHRSARESPRFWRGDTTRLYAD